MTFVRKAFYCFLMAHICLQFSNAQSMPGRCMCVKTTTKRYTLADLEEFYIIEPQHLCNAYEIIVTLKAGDGETKLRCLDPNKKLGTILRQCWARKNEGGSKTTVKASECLHKTE